jgi:hypothetical protein
VRSALLIFVLSAEANAQEYVRTIAGTSGTTVTCVTWNRRDYTYHVDAAGSARTPGETEFDAIDAAFATWQALSDTCSDFKFLRGDRVTSPVVGQHTESANVVTFREASCVDAVPKTDPCLGDGSCVNQYHCWDHSTSTIALTTVSYSTRTGVALDADIELNAAVFLFTTVASPPCLDGREGSSCVAYDVQNTMTHEIGHVVGFDHAFNPGSTMLATAPLGETSKRILDVGTGSGFCSTYPRGQPPVPCDDQASLSRRIIARSTGSCANIAVGEPALLLAAGLMTLRRQRRRRNRPRVD